MFSWIITSTLIFLSSFAWANSPKQLHFVTYELPPYMKKDLPEGGAAIAVLKELFKKQGYDIKVTFAAVGDTPKKAAELKDTVGYFPEVAENLPKNFILSRNVQQSTWSLAERVKNPISWKNHSDLTKYRIGNVVGYEIAGVLKPLRDKKLLQIEDVGSDEENLLKLAKGRVDMAFIDMSTFAKQMENSEKLKPYKDKLRLNPRPLQVYQYGVAFKNTAEGKEALRVFNSTFSESDFMKSVEAYFIKNKGLL
ncbi:hypothetical protein [Bdellovibrio sp. HCB209]|uniref:hypothetical protein n=1 Tax=Bdellovibrio sp. HCB209 TaxID=3394354 RepID=UPI0039B59139